MGKLVRAIIAGALLWIAISLVVAGYRPVNAGSVIANIEIGLGLVVAIIACFILGRGG